MKRRVLLAGILGVVLMLGCTACGGKDKEAQVTDAEVTAEGETLEEAPIEYPGLRDLGEMLAEAEGVDYEEVVGDQSGYKKGKVTETNYESRYVGIQFTLPEGYRMDTDTMTMMNELTDSLAEEMFGIDQEFAFRCEMIARNVENENVAAMVMSMEMDTTDDGNSVADIEEAINAEGVKTVSKWGQDWLYMPIDKINSNNQALGDIYTKVYPDAFYIIGITYDEDSVKEKKVLLSAFEEAPREVQETAGTEE